MGGNGELDYQWEPVGYEELAWRVDHDASSENHWNVSRGGSVRAA